MGYAALTMARPAPLWLARPTRFAGVHRTAGRALLLLLALIVVVALTAVDAPDTPRPPVPAEGAQAQSDVLLYQRIVAGVRTGENYYTIAADAQRAGGYPLRPFMTMRLPTLALVQAALPDFATLALLYGLAALVALAWYRQMRRAFSAVFPRILALLLLGCGAMVCLRPDLVTFHEIWAGLLIALSLGWWRPGRWVEPVAIGLCAMLIRETAVVYALVMLGCAVLSRQRREAMGWAFALVVFAAMVALHARAWGMVVMASDAASPGWNALLGPGFFAKTVAQETALAALPLVLAAPLALLGLAGWAVWRDPLAVRTGLVLGGYGVLIALFCRADTPYWGLMAAPLSLIGLIFVPDGLRDIAWAANNSRRIIVTKRVE
ncbi:MAG: hypothetical protein WC803_05675 [Sphingomonas sp.]|jgi:hypothetical protein